MGCTFGHTTQGSVNIFGIAGDLYEVVEHLQGFPVLSQRVTGCPIVELVSGVVGLFSGFLQNLVVAFQRV
jgi:hypothetical protein